jgi:beta-phosphoglucomutase-like phosphatase (HAD superfamily)
MEFDLFTKPSNTFFLMIDLDGTLSDTDKVHYEAYRQTFLSYNISFTREQFDTLIHFSSIDSYIKDIGIPITEFKEKKLNIMLCQNDISFTEGAENFLNYLITQNINFVIVTNTSLKVIQHFKECLPLLQKIKN